MNKLLVLSGKGGTGKTTISSALIKLSKARLIADCDVDAPNLHLVMAQSMPPLQSEFVGGEKAVVNHDLCIGCLKCLNNCRFNAIRTINQKIKIQPFSCEGCGVCSYLCPTQAIILEKQVSGMKSLYLSERIFSTATLKMGEGNSGKLVSEVKKDLFAHALTDEWMIVDGSPGIGCPVIASLSGMDKVLIVSEASVSGFSDLKRLLHTIESFDIKVYVCVNKYDISHECTQTIIDYCERLKICFVGKIPFDYQAIKAINNGLSVVDVDCTAGRIIKEMYKMIFQEESSLDKGENYENCSIV
ncbi:MAG: ATP-binding protein [Erysipelotrichaceae bacterium]